MEAKNKTRRSEEPKVTAVQLGPPKSGIRDFIEQGLITVVMALFLMTFIAQAVQVPTGSMQNTINIGDNLFVNKFVFGSPTSWLRWLLPTREIHRGDVIVFKLPSDPKTNYVKRVIGLPGDKVHVRGREVYVNDQLIPEQHVLVKVAGFEDYSALPEIRTEPPPPGAALHRRRIFDGRGGSADGEVPGTAGGAESSLEIELPERPAIVRQGYRVSGEPGA